MVQKTKEARLDKEVRKERSSADAKTAINATPKKNGQGGGFTWGGNADVEKDGYFEPHDPAKQAFAVSGSPIQPRRQESGPPTPGFSMKDSDFPPLSPKQTPSSPEQKKNADQWQMNILMDKTIKCI